MESEIATIDTDIKVRLPELSQKVRQLLMLKADDFDIIINNVIDNFDFERLLKTHIEDKIQDSISLAFQEIDLIEEMKSKIWAEINSRLNKENK